MGVVAGIHLAVFFFIAKGLGIVPSLTMPPEPIEASFADPQPVDVPPPDPVGPPSQEQLDIRVPMPDELTVESDPQNTIVAQALPPDGLDMTGSGPNLPQPVVISARQDVRHPLSQPPYPPGEIRAGNEGNADVEVYVLPNGRVGDARIVRSTGFDRLDRSALDEAKRNWRLLPATRDGVPVAQWYKVRVTFKITGR
ncbi:MAG TPA: TonB family protein [Steroidobacteraceae bacterium]|nr:TonB family protein [Steroidobacteraceae bacterium]